MADLRSTGAVLRKLNVDALVENKDNPSVVMCDSSIVFGRARSCFGWLTCLRVIVWSGVCCASLILALNSCQRAAFWHFVSLLAGGSYVKCACHKNAFHINPLYPLVETLALMNHDLSDNESLFTQNSSIWKTVSASLRVGMLWSTALEKASCARWTIITCSGCVFSVCLAQCVAEKTTGSDALSDALHQQ